jgi:PAS domain S-box-containing protein
MGLLENSAFWILLSTIGGFFALSMAFLYTKDGDKRKLMFSIASIIASLNLLGGVQSYFGNTWFPERFRYWSSVPVAWALFVTVLWSLLKRDNFDRPFKYFLLVLTTSFLVPLTPISFPLEATLARVLAASLVLCTVLMSAYLCLTRKELSSLMFLLAVSSFVLSSLLLYVDLDSGAITEVFGYVFLFLMFVTSRNSTQGGMSSLFSLQKQLKNEQEKFHSLFDLMTDPVAIINNEGKFLEINDRIETLSGYRKDELIGKSLFNTGLFDAENRSLVLEKMAGLADEGFVAPFEVETTNKECIRRFGEVSAKRIDYNNAPVILFVFHDTTERRILEEKLAALNFYGGELVSANDLNRVYDLTLEAMEQLLGFEHAAFMRINQNVLRVANQRGYPEPFALELPLDGSKKGVTVTAAKTGKPMLVLDVSKEENYFLGAQGIRSELAVPIKTEDRTLGVLNVESEKLAAFDDKSAALLRILASHAAIAISDLERREELAKARNQIKEYAERLEFKVNERTRALIETQSKLLQSERLAAIGQLAAMVGHDLRNPLTGIGAATYYLRKKLASKPDEKTREMFEVIEKDIEYANSIITDLLEYSREIRLITTETSPSELVKETLSLVKAPPNIQVIDSTKPEPKIEADIEKMKRVFANITRNAFDAMPEGGKLTITSKNSGGSVDFAFTDTGVGISKEVLEKIWTPLFTTKSKGIGLGLPICKRFVEAHGGRITVESEVNEGTTFTVTIPISNPSLSGGEKT